MSAPINDGGPAFARTLGETERHEHAMSGQGPAPFAQSGMSLRDYFAARAMEGLLSGQFMELGRACDETKQKMDEMVARTAYHFADEMLKARAS